jgi:hypothetical protein
MSFKSEQERRKVMAEELAREREGKPPIETEHLPLAWRNPLDEVMAEESACECEGELPIETEQQSPDLKNPEPDIKSFARSGMMWVFVIFVCFLVAIKSGTKAKYAIDQNFLYGLIAMKTITLAGIVGTLVSNCFTPSWDCSTPSWDKAIFKLIVIGTLGFVMFWMSIFSIMVIR